MASQMDSRLNFSQRFDDLFAGSPRAKEIFASFYKTNGSTGTEKRGDDCSKQIKGSGLLTEHFRKKNYNKEHKIKDSSEVFKVVLPGPPTGVSIPLLDNIAKEINTEDPHTQVLCADISFGERTQADAVDDEMENCNEQVNMALKKLDSEMTTIQKEGAKKVIEHVLGNWSLQSVEISKNRKEIILEGHRSTDPQMQNWRSTVICERVSARSVKTKSGSVYHLSGSIDERTMNEKGFPVWLTKAFKNGFPSNWKNLLQKHYNGMKSIPPNNKSKKKETRENTNKKENNNNAKVKNEVKREPRKTRNMKKEASQSEDEKVQVVRKSRRKTSQKSAFLTPPTSVLPKEHDIKRSRSGRIIAPPLEYWRGQRIISNEHNESIAIVKCHLEENSVQLLPNKTTPLCRTYLNLESSKRRKPQKGRQPTSIKKETSSNGTTTEGVTSSDTAFTLNSDIDSVTSTTYEYSSTDERTTNEKTTTETTGSDSVTTSSVVKTLSYTNSDSTTDGSTGDHKSNKQRFSKRNMLVSQTTLLLDENGNHTQLRSKTRELGQQKNQTRAKTNNLAQNNERVLRKSGSSGDDSSSITNPPSSLQLCITTSKEKMRAKSLDSGSNNRLSQTHAEMLKQSKVSDFQSSDTELVKNAKRDSRKRTPRYTNLNELELIGDRSKTLRSFKRQKVTKSSKSNTESSLSSNITNPPSSLQLCITTSGEKMRAKSLGSGSNNRLSQTHAEMLKQSKVSDFQSSDTETVKNAKRDSRKRTSRYTNLNELELIGDRSKTLRSFKRQKVTKSSEINTESSVSSGKEGIPQQPEECGSKTQDDMVDNVKDVSGKTMKKSLQNRTISPSNVVAGTSQESEESAKRTYMLRSHYPLYSDLTVVECPAQLRHKKSTSQGTDNGKKELRNSERAGKTGVVDKKFLNRKHTKTKQVLKHVVPIVQSTSEEIWSEEEKDKLTQALCQIPPATAMYWQKVAHVVKTRNAEECQHYIQKDRLVKNQKKKAPRKIEEKVVCKELTAKEGTLARMRQLRDILEQHDDGHEDDYFDSTPFRNQKLIKFSPVDLVGEEIASEELETEPGYMTPFSRTPTNRLRPVGPLTASGKSESDYVSPGELLQHVNRNEIDRYVHQLKNRKRGRHVKPVKSHTPVSKKTSNPHPLSFNDVDCFDVREAPSDPEEEGDYYWSDE